MIYCFLAEGFEEVEALAAVDMIRRADLELKIVGVNNKTICGAHKIKVECDCVSDEITLDSNLNAIILPGGMPGTLNLEKSNIVQNAIDFAYKNGKLICAICAAPSILGHKGLLDGKNAIAYPGFENELIGAVISEKHVVRDGNIITAKGAGVAVDFGLEIVSYILGTEKAEEIRKSIQCR
ncbi:MAG: DJ-1/PfpI family protein [Clostridia bacterium]|nr:DJ-1/PfpI family protein [Clostridia bacterium]